MKALGFPWVVIRISAMPPDRERHDERRRPEPDQGRGETKASRPPPLEPDREAESEEHQPVGEDDHELVVLEKLPHGVAEYP